MLEGLLAGIGSAALPQNLVFILAGTVLGILIGAMPGLNSTVGLAILLPFTVQVPVDAALLMMVALYMAAEYGGSIAAIAVGVPGTSAAVATTFDGYPLTRRGEGAKALGVSLVSSSAGGVFGALVLMLAFGPLSRLSLAFGPAEYFALGVFGLSIVGNLTGRSVVKGFVSAVLGLLLFVVGLDVLSGYPRLTFGSTHLLDGIELVPVMIGFFAVAEVFRLAEAGGAPERRSARIRGRLPRWAEVRGLAGTILRSSAIGAGVGAVPGAGATIASFIAYGEAKRASRTPERFGEGSLEGVAAPEAANNAAVGGALIPLLTLGIPGSGSTAVMLGAFMLHGLNPGPLLMAERPGLVYELYGGLLLAATCLFGVGLVGIPIWTRIIALRPAVLTPLVLGVSLVGAFALGGSIFHMGVAVVFGWLGYLMLRYDIPLVPAVLGLVLGPMIEANYRRALSLSGGSHAIFLTHPISLVLLILAAAGFAVPLARARAAARRERAAAPSTGAGDTTPTPRAESVPAAGEKPTPEPLENRP